MGGNNVNEKDLAFLSAASCIPEESVKTNIWGQMTFTKDHFDDDKMKKIQASEAYLKAWETSSHVPEADLVEEEESPEGWIDLDMPELIADGVPSFSFSRNEIMEQFARKHPQEKDTKFYAKKAALRGLWSIFEENDLTCIKRVGVGIHEVWSSARQEYVFESNTTAYLTFDGSLSSRKRSRCTSEVVMLLDEGIMTNVCKINFRWNTKVRKPTHQGFNHCPKTKPFQVVATA